MEIFIREQVEVEDRGLEPLTFWLPARRSPNWANPPRKVFAHKMLLKNEQVQTSERVKPISHFYQCQRYIESPGWKYSVKNVSCSGVKGVSESD